jgi:hypothetical protein
LLPTLYLSVPSLLPTTTRSLTLSPMACRTVRPEMLFVPALEEKHKKFDKSKTLQSEYL